MRSRLAIAVVGVPVVYLLTWLPFAHAIAFALLVAAAATVALAELYVMLRPYGPFVPAGLITCIAMPLFCWRALEPGIVAGFLLLIPLLMIFIGLSARRKALEVSIAVTSFGVAYVGLAASVIVLLREANHGFGLILILLAGTWLTDSGAFVGGNLFGKHKLAPRVSPNKTIEGFACGVVVGSLVVWYAHFLTGNHGHYWLTGGDALILGIAISLATTLGDLFESTLKRAAGVKDSGNLLRAHGGMLDRLDAILLSAPAMYIVAFAIGALL